MYFFFAHPASRGSKKNLAWKIYTAYIHYVKRDYVVHTLTHSNSVIVAMVNDFPFFRTILTPRVATVRSNLKGFYQVEQSPGQYSVFVYEDSLYYANRFDGYGNIMPVTVQKDSTTQLTIDIEYKKLM